MLIGSTIIKPVPTASKPISKISPENFDMIKNCASDYQSVEMVEINLEPTPADSDNDFEEENLLTKPLVIKGDIAWIEEYDKQQLLLQRQRRLKKSTDKKSEINEPNITNSKNDGDIKNTKYKAKRSHEKRGVRKKNKASKKVDDRGKKKAKQKKWMMKTEDMAEAKIKDTIAKQARNMRLEITETSIPVRNPLMVATEEPPEKISERRKHIVNIRAIMEFSNATPFKGVVRGIECDFCKLAFKQANDFRHHVWKEHPKKRLYYLRNLYTDSYTAKLDITDLKCTICGSAIEDIKSLRKHLKSAHDKLIYDDIKDHVLPFKLTNDAEFNCIICNTNYDTFKYLHQHMNSHYSNYFCETCGAGFLNVLRLGRHVARHADGNFPCTYCGKIFQSMTKKKSHEKGVHLGQWDREKCYLCPQRFSNVYMRDQHLFEVHGIERRQFPCKSCDKVFVIKALLNKHIRRDHLLEGKVDCKICGKAFRTKSNYINHMAVHNGESPFKCELCPKAFKSSKTLYKHKKTHTRTAVPNICNPMDVPTNDLPPMSVDLTKTIPQVAY